MLVFGKVSGSVGLWRRIREWEVIGRKLREYEVVGRRCWEKV